jgi:hypothetical protein
VKGSILSEVTWKTLVCLAVVCYGLARADTPLESYHVTYGREIRASLKDAVGVLTISSRDADTVPVLTAYERLGVKPRFVPPNTLVESPDTGGYALHPRRLGVLNATIPVSNFDYVVPISPLSVSGYRYPIVERHDRFVQIVYNPIENRRGWVSLDSLNKGFHTEVVVFDSMALFKPGETPRYFLDLFQLIPDRKCRLYEAPRLDTAFTIFAQPERETPLLVPIEVRNGFVRVGKYQTEPPKVTPLGWVRIRDDEGVPLIWIIYIDTC